MRSPGLQPQNKRRKMRGILFVAPMNLDCFNDEATAQKCFTRNESPKIGQITPILACTDWPLTINHDLITQVNTDTYTMDIGTRARDINFRLCIDTYACGACLYNACRVRASKPRDHACPRPSLQLSASLPASSSMVTMTKTDRETYKDKKERKGVYIYEYIKRPLCQVYALPQALILYPSWQRRLPLLRQYLYLARLATRHSRHGHEHMEEGQQGS